MTVPDKVRERRLALGLTQSEAAAKAGLGLATWNSFESGSRPTIAMKTKRAICAALEWTADSLRRIEEGGEPAELHATTGEARGDMVKVSRDELLHIRSVIDHLLSD
jgi:DNA-binding XRE family transcriptional regulator